jgi:hypothetical protein
MHCVSNKVLLTILHNKYHMVFHFLTVSIIGGATNAMR